MSEKQEALKDYLIKRLGFEEGEFLTEYLEYILGAANQFRNVRAILAEKDNKGNVISAKPPKDHYELDGEYWLPERYTIIDFLIDEYNLKKNKRAERKTYQNNERKTISATDMAAFVFCPASYAISKTFKVESLKSAEIGKASHEESRLSFHFKKFGEQEKYDEVTEQYINHKNSPLFDDIKNSKLIFSGHSNNEVKFFQNSKGNFVGQPDYVFVNKKSGKTFIVEEKYKFNKSGDQAKYFYSNHKVQLYSYIYGLNQFKADYGYLVYWVTGFEEYEFKIFECNAYRLDKNDAARQFLNDTFQAVQTFNEKRVLNFNTNNLNPNKCANCAVSQYCGHKTKKFNDLELPYNSKYHQLQNAPYPDILKKDTSNELPEINISENEPTKPFVSQPYVKKSKSGYSSKEEKDILNSLDW